MLPVCQVCMEELRPHVNVLIMYYIIWQVMYQTRHYVFVNFFAALFFHLVCCHLDCRCYIIRRVLLKSLVISAPQRNGKLLWPFLPSGTVNALRVVKPPIWPLHFLQTIACVCVWVCAHVCVEGAKGQRRALTVFHLCTCFLVVFFLQSSWGATRVWSLSILSSQWEERWSSWERSWS